MQPEVEVRLEFTIPIYVILSATIKIVENVKNRSSRIGNTFSIIQLKNQYRMKNLCDKLTNKFKKADESI